MHKLKQILLALPLILLAPAAMGVSSAEMSTCATQLTTKSTESSVGKLAAEVISMLVLDHSALHGTLRSLYGSGSMKVIRSNWGPGAGSREEYVIPSKVLVREAYIAFHLSGGFSLPTNRNFGGYFDVVKKRFLADWFGDQASIESWWEAIARLERNGLSMPESERRDLAAQLVQRLSKHWSAFGRAGRPNHDPRGTHTVDYLRDFENPSPYSSGPLSSAKVKLRGFAGMDSNELRDLARLGDHLGAGDEQGSEIRALVEDFLTNNLHLVLRRRNNHLRMPELRAALDNFSKTHFNRKWTDQAFVWTDPDEVFADGRLRRRGRSIN